jgi:zinc protease
VGYTDFGPPGTVVSDTVEPLLGIRTLRFANGLRLNLKQTDLAARPHPVELNIDGGELLNTRDDPLATAMDSALPVGGLGKHSIDELQSILAGSSGRVRLQRRRRDVRVRLADHPARPRAAAAAVAAALSDPGFRPEARRSTAAASRTSSPAATPPPRTRSATRSAGSSRTTTRASRCSRRRPTSA